MNKKSAKKKVRELPQMLKPSENILVTVLPGSAVTGFSH